MRLRYVRTRLRLLAAEPWSRGAVEPWSRGAVEIICGRSLTTARGEIGM